MQAAALGVAATQKRQNRHCYPEGAVSEYHETPKTEALPHTDTAGPGITDPDGDGSPPPQYPLRLLRGSVPEGLGGDPGPGGH